MNQSISDAIIVEVDLSIVFDFIADVAGKAVERKDDIGLYQQIDVLSYGGFVDL